MKKLFAGLAALALFATGCGAESESGSGSGSGGGNGEGPIQIGAMFELTGPVSAYGTAELQGAQLAVQEINEAGGVLGQDLEILDYDTKSDNTEAASVATKLATDDEVPVIIGPATSGATQSATPAVTRAEVPLVTPSGTADSLTLDESGNVQSYIFRTTFQDSFQGVALADFATNNLNSSRAVIIGDNSSDYAIGLTEAFKGAYEGEIVAEENFTAEDSDFSAILTRIRNEDFDVIYVPGYYEQAGLIIKQAREMGIEQPILGADGFGNEALLELAGTGNVNDVYYSAAYSPNSEDEQVQSFIEAYNEEFGNQPDAFAALGYDTVYLVQQAIENAGEATPEAIQSALEGIENFDGVTGTFSIDENHNPVKSTLVIELQEGEEVNSTEVTP